MLVVPSESQFAERTMQHRWLEKAGLCRAAFCLCPFHPDMDLHFASSLSKCYTRQVRWLTSQVRHCSQDLTRTNCSDRQWKGDSCELSRRLKNISYKRVFWLWYIVWHYPNCLSLMMTVQSEWKSFPITQVSVSNVGTKGFFWRKGLNPPTLFRNQSPCDLMFQTNTMTCDLIRASKARPSDSPRPAIVRQRTRHHPDGLKKMWLYWLSLWNPALRHSVSREKSLYCMGDVDFHWFKSLYRMGSVDFH
jgi:hypothetical protein